MWGTEYNEGIINIGRLEVQTKDELARAGWK